MRVLGRLRCAPEISLGGQVSRVSKAVGPIMHRREKGRLHSGVERDIAESDIVHLPLPPNTALLSRRSGIPVPSLSFDTDNEPCPIRPIFILLPSSKAADSEPTGTTTGATT